MSSRPKPKKRVAFFFLLILACLVLVGGRMAYIQIYQGASLSAKAQSQVKNGVVIQSPRGTIYDRAGRELAISGMTKSLYANPKQLNMDADMLAGLLSPILEMEIKTIKERLQFDGSFVWIKRTLESDKAQALEIMFKERQIRGFDFVDESKRHYPNDGLAAHVLGFVGTDDVGLEGIEAALDDILKGDNKPQLMERDALGNPIFNSILGMRPRREGKSVYLTIDSSVQCAAEQSLDKAMASTKARAGIIIIMNPHTGEILAMVSRPGYNPNQFSKYTPQDRKNNAVSIVYEPGSTFKPLIAAAAMQEGLANPNTGFNDIGFIEVNGRRIKNWDGEGSGNVTLTDIIKNSINTGFVQLGLRLGAMKMNEYVRNFGFGSITGLELPGEEEGILFNPRDMQEIDVATMSIGHGIAVTPLQLLAAMGAIANDGVLLKPYIVKEIRNPDGTVFKSTPTTPLRQVIKAETAKSLSEMMAKVVSEGGGKKAIVKGYSFAGKTGTAERLSEKGGYEDGRYIASFAGFGPVDNPQVVALIVIDDPKGIYYGGEIAAPVFSDMMTTIMRYLNVRPAHPVVMAPTGDGKPAQTGVPLSVPKTAPEGMAVVPNLEGRTMREAAELAEKAGLAFAPSGTGRAAMQKPAPGTMVEKGSEIRALFE